MKRKRIQAAKWVLFYLLVIALLIFIVFPIYWVVSTSFKYQRDFMSAPPVYFTTELTLDHYVKAFRVWNAFPYIRNSLIISGGATAVTLLLSIPAAYAISKYRVGGTKLSAWLTIQRMLPPVVLIIPLYLLFSTVNLIDTYTGTILPYLVFTIPYATLLLIGFFTDIPPSLQVLIFSKNGEKGEKTKRDK